jgi:F-box and WD-40 domain protein 1/11/F-box/WD-40 domain protein 7
MLYSGSYDHSIRSWDLREMHDRIRERSIMFAEDLWSKKHDAYYTKLYAKKKKKKTKKK